MVAELCDRHGLVPTGGSDYHGTKKPDLAVGIGVKAARGTPPAASARRGPRRAPGAADPR